MQAVDADLVGDPVEIGVAGLHDRRVHVDGAVAVLAPVAIAMARPGELPEAAAVVRRLRRDDVVLERGERHHRLDRGARRVDAAQRPVIERLVDVVGQRAVLGHGEAAREAVRVEGRRAREGDHLSVRRIDRDHGAALAGERVLRGLLRAEVDRQVEVGTRDRLLALELLLLDADALDAPALRVHQQLLVSRLAVQLVLVAALDAVLADERRARIVRRIDALLVLLADGADVPERVHGRTDVRVVARQARPDLDALQVRAVDREACEFLLGELQLDRHGLETAARVDRAPGALHLAGVEQADLDQLGERRIHVRRLLADQLELVGGPVECERHTVAVEDQAARRRDRVDADAVALREVAEVVVLDDLQEEQPGAERREAGEHHESRGDHAPAEQALFGPVILEADGACHDPRAPLSRRVD